MNSLLQFLLQIWRRLLSSMRRGRYEREMEEEMRFHLEMQIEQNLSLGMAAEEAHYAARRQFGNQTWLKEVSREMWSLNSIETLIQDLRYGARMLLKNPGFTLIAVITLAIGIGANTAIFSVVNSVLLRPLNYPDSERILTLWEDHTRRDGPQREWTSPPGFQDWREMRNVFAHVAAINNWGPTLTEAGEPEALAGASVSHDAFSVLGVRPMLGREFSEQEDKPNAEKVVVISYGLWQRRFNGDRAIVGRPIRLGGDSYTVIGVMPAGFQFPVINNAEIFRTISATFTPNCQRGCYTIRVIARLNPDVTLDRARAEMTALAGRIEQQYPEVNKNVGVTLVPLHEFTVGDMRPAMLVLLLAVGFVLLIACANVANLTLVKAAARHREIAVRAALGAGRWRVARQLLSESLALALLGGGLGLIVAFQMVALLKAISPDGTPRLDEIRIDGRALLFSLGITALTGLLCGLVPALQASKSDLNLALREAGAGARASVAGGRARSALVVAEIALALTLLVGAGLLMRSFVRLQRVDPGFAPANVLTARIGLPLSMYPNREQVRTFYDQLHERLKALPGVQAVSFGSSVPMTGVNTDTSFTIEGRPAPPPDQRPSAWVSTVSNDYFRAMKIRLIEGRLFDGRESATAPSAVVISESMARRYWPNDTPVGKRIGFGGQQVRWVEIVGVVADVRHFGLSNDARPTFYFSSRERPLNFMTMAMRTNGYPLSHVAAVRKEAQALDGNLAVANVQTMERLVSDSIAAPRFVMLLLGSFAFVALLLAGLGIYGVMAYSVAQRTQEIGIRIALGSQSRDVLRLVVGQGMKLALVGVGIGLAASFGLTRLMSKLLFSVSPTDPLTFAAIVVLLLLIALLACWLPARRATKVDPIVALRVE
jgi:putative ABC transport system permease protein